MAFTLDPQTEKITFGVVADGTHDGIAIALADRFGAGADFNDDFSTYLNQTEADTAWVPQDTPDNQVDIANDNYFFTVKRDGTNFSTSFDLGAGNVSNTQWLLRAKVTIGTPYTVTTNLSSGIAISLTDRDSSFGFGASNDLIQMSLINTIVGGGAQHSIAHLDNGSGTSSTTGTTTGWVAGETIYIELKRESNILIRSTIYTDASFTTIRDSITRAISGGENVENLRYIKLGGASDVTAWDGVFTGTIDEIQFWNGVTEPTLSNNWQLRFKLDITNLDDGANATDKRLYMLMTDEDEVSDANNPQDSIGLLLRHDNAISSFSIQDTNGTSPTSATADNTFTTVPSVSTFFVEIRRLTIFSYQVSLFPDNTFMTPTETEVGEASINTVQLRYIKFMNDVTFNGAGAIDGTIDDINFTDISAGGVETNKIFIVDSLIVDVSPTWSYREHELNTNPSFPPNASFGVEVASPNRFETATGPGNGISNNYIFKTFKKSEITGSEVDIIWEKTGSTVASHTFRVIDGAYDKDSLTDFVPGAGSPTSKGGGVLGSFSSFPNHAEQTNTLTGINWGASVLPDVTVIAFITDTNDTPFGTIFIKEFNIRGTDNGENFKWEFLSPTVTAETTGTKQDAGYVNASSALAGVRNSACGIDLTDLKAYWNFDEVSGTLINQATAVGSVDSLGTSADSSFVGGSIDRQQAGQVSDSYRFDGLTETQASNRIIIGTSVSQFNFLHTPNSKGTVNVWVNPGASYQTFETIMNNENQTSLNTGFLMSINSGFISVRPRAPSTEILSTTTVSTILPLNQFTMVTAVWDELIGVDVYFDGVFIETLPRAVNTASSGNANFAMNIATFPQTQPNLTLDGSLDEMSIWSRKLTADEISTLFFLGNSGDPLQTVGGSCFTVDALIQIQGDNGFCLGAYTNDMSLGSEWVSLDIVAPGFFDVTGGVLDFDTVADNTNDTISIDLSDPSRLGAELPDSGGWRMRCTLKWTGLNLGNSNHMFIGLSNFQSVNYGAGVEDAIMIRFQGDNANVPIVPRWIPDFKNSLTAPDLTEPVGRITNLFNTTSTFGVEIRRDSATQATCTLYTDGTFTTIIRQDTYTIPSTVTGLKFFKVGNWKFFNNSEMRLQGEIDNLVVEVSGGTGSVGSVACAQVDALIQSQGVDGSCTPIVGSYTDDFTSDRFVDADSNFIFVGSDRMNFDAQTDDSNDASASDISLVGRFGSILPTTWRIRFSINLTAFSTGENNHMMFSIGDEDQTINSKTGEAEQSIGIHAITAVTTGATRVLGYHKDGLTQITAPERLWDGSTETLTGIKYYQMERTGDTSVTYSVFSDAGFTTLINSVVQTIPNLTGLQYFKVSNWKFNNTGEGSVIGFLDDLEITSGGGTGNAGCMDVDAITINRVDETFTVDALLQRTCGNIAFQDDFTTNANWTQVSTGVSVTGGEIQGWGADASDRRVFHDLVTPVDDNGWKAEFECEFSFFSTFFFGPAHDIFGVSDTTASGATLQDYIGVRFTGVNNPGGQNRFQIIISDNAIVNAVFATNPTLASTNTRYFVRLERLSLTDVKMSIFTGGFDVTPFGTPVTGTIPSTITGLRVITSANNIFGNSARILTGVLDNLIIFSGTFECPTFTVDARVKALNTDKTFSVDGIAFIPPARLFLVNAVLTATINEDFNIDSCLRISTFVNFEVDACIQQNNNETAFDVDGHVFILPVRNVLVDAIVRYAQGSSLLGAIPDLIIQALRDNPPTLTGRGIVDKVVEITTADPTIPFTGKTSRIKNWLNRLRLDGLIQEDGSDPDWHETNWSLV